MSDDKREWVRYNPLTHCHETPDGTVVAAELVDNCQSLLDFLFIATIRDKQRKAIPAPPQEQQ